MKYFKRFNSYELNFLDIPYIIGYVIIILLVFHKHTNNINYMIFTVWKSLWKKFIYELFIELSYMKVHKSLYLGTV